MRNDNILIRMLLSDHVPCFVRVDQTDCRVWYAGQPPPPHYSTAAPQVIALQPALSRGCAGAAVSPAIWPGSAPRLGGLQFLFLPWKSPLNLPAHLTVLKAIAFAWWPFLPIFKMLLFLEYKLFFRAVFLHRTTLVC